ncbi:hypothetical protein WJX74_005388 [Apatococcus lobatus]|uniref:Uncharacterized protein n=1 Tax=Apatococcus lobatus TaxID=904363 RepID=A0AAW1R2Q5_9CHLO
MLQGEPRQADDGVESALLDLLAPSPGPWPETVSPSHGTYLDSRSLGFLGQGFDLQGEDSQTLQLDSQIFQSLSGSSEPTKPMDAVTAPTSFPAPMPPGDIAQKLVQGHADFRNGSQQTPEQPALLGATVPAAANAGLPSSVNVPSQLPLQGHSVAKRSTSTSASRRQSYKRHFSALAEPSFPEVNRANRRQQSILQCQSDGVAAPSIRSLIPHQELVVADCLSELALPDSLNPHAFEPEHPALRGIATARGMHMFEVADLKRRHLQDLSQHPGWAVCSHMGNECLLDIYTAFAASDLSFKMTLLVGNTQQIVSLGTLCQHNLCDLYMQSIAGLADFAPRALNGPETADGRHFSQAACQCMAMIACLFEMPGHTAKLADLHLMKHAAGGQQSVSGTDLMMRLDQALSLQWKRSITRSQRHQARLLLQANEAFTTQLANARQQILDEMQQAVQGEADGPKLLPSRVLMLSDHAHTLSVLLALAYEAALQLGRKFCYEILSPWQWGMMTACLYPVVPDIMYCVKYLAGDQPVSDLPQLSDAALLHNFDHLRQKHDIARADAETSHP